MDYTGRYIDGNKILAYDLLLDSDSCCYFSVGFVETSWRGIGKWQETSEYIMLTFPKDSSDLITRSLTRGGYVDGNILLKKMKNGNLKYISHSKYSQESNIQSVLDMLRELAKAKSQNSPDSDKFTLRTAYPSKKNHR